MTDAELIARLRSQIGDDVQHVYDHEALFRISADRIEELIAERDQHWDSFVHWRKEADDRSEQLSAARQDAKEAEAYAEEFEKELNTCRMAQAVMDNTVADLEAKLEKAVEAIEARIHWSAGGLYCNCWKCDPLVTTLTEIKGESHD